MKIKKIFTNILAILMISTCCLCFTACEDIVRLEVKFDVYNYTTESMYDKELSTITIDLYRHLAPETVESVIKSVEKGEYNDTIVYKFTDSNTDQYMMGDLKWVDGEIKQILRPEIKGEFATNGVQGSNLKVEKGSVAIWRSYHSRDLGMATSSEARNTGRGTWYMPTEANALYEGTTCVFGKMDLESDSVKEMYTAFESVFADNVRYETYEVYYTGTYDESKAFDNYGLTFHCVKEEEFKEIEKDIEDLFTADNKEQQLAWFNHYTISVPVFLSDGAQSLRIASVKVVK